MDVPAVSGSSQTMTAVRTFIIPRIIPIASIEREDTTK
jgi:hypothetical protein